MGIVEALTELGSGVAGLFVSILGELADVFVTSTTGTSGAVTLALTPIGYLALIGLVIGIVTFLFSWISKLIKRNR